MWMKPPLLQPKPKENFQEIVEGRTKIIVPRKSLTEKVPPKKPAFFNPKAKRNRDFSIIAYAGFLRNFAIEAPG